MPASQHRMHSLRSNFNTLRISSQSLPCMDLRLQLEALLTELTSSSSREIFWTKSIRNSFQLHRSKILSRSFLHHLLEISWMMEKASRQTPSVDMLQLNCKTMTALSDLWDRDQTQALTQTLDIYSLQSFFAWCAVHLSSFLLIISPE